MTVCLLSSVSFSHHSTRTFKRINEAQTFKNVEGETRIIHNDSGLFLGPWHNI